MKESDYEQLSRKNRVMKSSKEQQQEYLDDERLELSEEHHIDTTGSKVNLKQEEKAAAPVAKTLFWFLRKLIAPVIMVAMLLIGLYVGYVVIADQPSDEVFKFETWKHLWDLIFADS